MVPPPASLGAGRGRVPLLPFPPAPAPRPFALRRWLLALAVALMGLVDLASAVLSHPPDRLLALRHLVPSLVRDSSRTFTLLAGLLLLVTAWGLRRGKRRAFVAALFLCAVSVPVNLLKAIDYEEATVASALLFLLGVSAQAFRVQSRELSFALLRSRAIAAVIALFAYAAVGSWLLERQLGVHISFSSVWHLALAQMFGSAGAALPLPDLPLFQARILRWYVRSVPLLSVTVVVGLALAALRPARHRQRHRADARLVEQLLLEHGMSSLAWFALADDVDYFWSPDRRAVIAYRFESDVVLAIGDPIGPPEALRPLLEGFAEFCWLHDWSFAFFQARPELLPLYRSLGWRALHIGEDPVLWTHRFTLAGSRMGNLRRSVHRAEEGGVRVLHWCPDDDAAAHAALPPRLWDELREVSDQWLRSRHGNEKGFCMGRFDPQRLRRDWVAVAWDARTGRVEGFVSWVPVPARNGWALDLIRRRNDSVPGTMDLLIVRSLERARERGDAMLSLSLSALAQVPAGCETVAPVKTAADHAREFLHEHLARFYDFQGVFRWKRRFDPAFEDRYLVHSGSSTLPRVVLALIRAQSPGGLLSYLRRDAPPAAPAPGERPAPQLVPTSD